MLTECARHTTAFIVPVPNFIPPLPHPSRDAGQTDTIIKGHVGGRKAVLLPRQLIPGLIISGCLALSLRLPRISERTVAAWKLPKEAANVAHT